MKKNGIMAVLLAAVFICGCFVSGEAFAGGKAKYMCCGGACPAYQAVMAKQKYKKEQGLKEKFCKKVRFFMCNQEEIGLSEQQIKKIKELKIETKKNIIMEKARIKVLCLDIEKKMWEEKLDLTAINVLVDQKYEIKKAMTKNIIKSYGELKEILTPDQMKIAKAIWMRDMKGKMGKAWAKK